MTTHDGVKIKLSTEIVLTLLTAAAIPTITMIYSFGQQNQKISDIGDKINNYISKTDTNTTDIATIKGKLSNESFLK